jgi:cathepsin L
MKLLVALALAFIVAASATSMEERFTQWMQKYEKSYDTDEFHYRYTVFQQNAEFVDTFDGPHEVALNKFADLTIEEFSSLYNGLHFDASSIETQVPVIIPETDFASLPSHVDWRDKGAVTGVKNQGQCGSCWSFSTTGSVEGAHFLSGNTLVGLSEQNLVDCSSSEGNQGCDGGLMDDAFQYIINNNGIDTEASYPYTAEDGTCHYSAANRGATISSYQDIPSGSESSLTDKIASVGPISVAIDAGQSSFQFYNGGVYYSASCSSTQLDHGVLAVGYGVSSGQDYYIVKNSWGTDWGLSGYIWMARNRNNNCGIATAASYPIA